MTVISAMSGCLAGFDSMDFVIKTQSDLVPIGDVSVVHDSSLTCDSLVCSRPLSPSIARLLLTMFVRGYVGLRAKANCGCQACQICNGDVYWHCCFRCGSRWPGLGARTRPNGGAVYKQPHTWPDWSAARCSCRGAGATNAPTSMEDLRQLHRRANWSFSLTLFHHHLLCLHTTPPLATLASLPTLWTGRGPTRRRSTPVFKPAGPMFFDEWLVS